MYSQVNKFEIPKSDAFEGGYYRTPERARRRVEDILDVFDPLLFGYVRRKHRRTLTRAAREAIPKELELFDTTNFTGATGFVDIYIRRKVSNEKQGAAEQIRNVLENTTKDGVYRSLGPGGWHITLGKIRVDLDSQDPEDFATSFRSRLGTNVPSLLVPVPSVSMRGLKVCGNIEGSYGSSRFIGLTPGPKAKFLEEMRRTMLFLDPTADVVSEKWFNTPHVSIATAGQKLFGLPPKAQAKIEEAIMSDVQRILPDLRPLVFTAGMVTLSDPL